ncbi:MAG: thiol peroxidase [Actinomycetaceae bacterium]|nr:thiol peroxidase [Actinomycetaceae bacterium]
MSETHLGGDPVATVGELPKVGDKAPDFTLVKSDLSEVKLSDYAGQRVVLNIYPSIDTGICAQSVRRFNQEAAKLDNTVVIGASMDLPFALDRFCSVEGIDDVITGSAFRSSFGEDYGVTLAASPMAGLLARTVMIIDEQGVIQYVALNDEIKTEPDYEAALTALANL